MAGGKFSDLAASQAADLPPPRSIATNADALDLLANAGKYIVFGDAHLDSDGHHALVALMPALSKSHVTVLGIEVPASLRKYVAALQSQLRAGGSNDAVFKSLQGQFKNYQVTGGDQTLHDFSDILESATKNNISVVPIDARDDATHHDAMSTMAKLAGAEKDEGKYYHILTRLDKETAANAYNAIKDQPEARMAILFGQAHSCHDDKDRLADMLSVYGSVTKVSLMQKKWQSYMHCAAPDIHQTVDAQALSKDKVHAIPGL